MNKLDVNNTHNGCAFLGVVLAVLLLSVTGWAACQAPVTNIMGGGTSGACQNGVISDNPYFGVSSRCQDIISEFSSNCNVECPSGCSGSDPTYTYQCCSNVCEADSLRCVNDGNVWSNDPSASCGKSCKINNCKAADSTWLSTSIAACTGSNNYAIVNTDSTCEHVGTCCPNDSIPSGNTCKWRCDSVLTTCNNRTGELFGGVLPDTSVSGQDTTFSYQCYYNCSHSPNPDSSVYLVEGNIVLGGPSDSIPDGIKSQSTFNSVRTTTGGVYVYDYLSPAASEYIDSIAAMKCVEHLWRCVINNKYVYWYDNQEVPAGCTNIVRVK